MLRKLLLSPWTALITLSLIVGLRAADPAFIESVRLRYFDTLITSQPDKPSSVAVVNIDESAMKKYGQFPFSRDVYGDIIRDLYQRGAGLVVFNVMTVDKDRMGRDRDYVETLRQYPVVLPNIGSAESRNRPKAPGSAVIGGTYDESAFVTYPGVIANYPLIESAAAGVGIVNTLPEVDGVVRRMPMVISYENKLYPSLSMETLRVAAGDSIFQVKVNPTGVEKMRIPQFGAVVTDSLSRIWIDWSQQSPVYSVTQLPKNFDGAVVIVGVSAAGLANPIATSRGEVLPHVAQAAAVSTLIANRTSPIIQRADWADVAEIASIALAGLLLIFLSRWMYVGIAAGVVIIGSVVPASWYIYSNYAWLVDASIAVGGLVVVMLHAYTVKFVSEFLQKQAIKKQFEGYASPAVVKLLQENPSIIKNGTKREVSIVFSDLRGFTPLGESFGDDVKGLTEVMNGYMDAITQPVLDANGMIIKYIGDASMHIHNAPVDDPDHAKTAVATGLKMLKAVKQFSTELEAKGRPGVKMGAGINTGLGYIGEMGSTKRHSYDVLGDAVSTAARIESKCKEYGCVLLVGGATVEQCHDEFFFLKVDDLAVKGKSVGVAIYTVLDDVTDAYRAAGVKHEEMHSLYRKQKFKQAIEMCRQLADEFDGQLSGYYEMWIERCEFQLTQKLPKDWDGIFVATTK